MANSETGEVVPENSSGDEADSFTIFQGFPKELRLKIWEIAIQDPRIVKLNYFALSCCEHAMVRVRSDMTVPDRCRNDHYSGSPGTSCTGLLGILPQDMESLNSMRIGWREQELVGFCSEMDPPSLLLVCKESYEVASKRYKRAFPALGALPETYFDYERDVLSLCIEYLETEVAIADQDSHLMVRAEACKVQNLSFSFDQIFFRESNTAEEDLRDRSVFVGHILQVFCNVKHLTIEVEDHAELFNGGKCLNEIRKELEWFEPIEVTEALDMFHSVETQTIDLHRGLLRESKRLPELDIDLEMVERHRLEDLEMGLVWQLPEIHWKHLVTTTFKTEFEALKKEYELRTGFVCHRIGETDTLTLDPSTLVSESREDSS